MVCSFVGLGGLGVKLRSCGNSFEVVLSIQRSDAARTGCGDGLAVGGVDDISGSKHAL
jgi:hypothetical protein